MHPIVDTLKAQRATAWEAAKKLLDAAEAEKRDLNAEEDAQYAAINKDLDAKDARIAEIVKNEKRAEVADGMREQVERAAAETPAVARAIANEETEVRSFLNGERRTFQSEVTPSVARWLMKSPDERRDTTTGSTGAPVPTSFADRLTMHLVEIGPMWDVATVMRTASGENFQFPRTTAHGASTFKAEGSALDETNPTFGAFITLGAWKYGTYQQYSYELINDSGIDLLGYIADQAAISLAVVTNTAFTVGNNPNAPNGIVPASTLGVTGGAGVTGAFTSDNLLELLYSVGPQYRRLSAAFMMADSSILKARKLKDGNGAYIYVPGLSSAEPDTLLGYPLFSNPDVVATGTSAKSIIYGALAKYMIRQAGPIRFERSDDFAFTEDLSTFKIAIRVDGDLLDQTGAVKHFIGNAA
jgi:HK97 family phage major capsid protein